MNRLRKWWKNLWYGAQLHVAFDSGGRRKPTIVFLHGIAATSRTWIELEHRLDYGTYRVIALDLLGFGESPMPEHAAYTPEEHTSYIHRTLRANGVKRPYMIVGHSMGSLLAVHYATRWPREVRRMILASMPLYLPASLTPSRRHKDINTLYQNAYTFFLTHKKFTVEGARVVRKVLQLKDGIDITEKNWQAFSRSLKYTIQQQRTYRELGELSLPMTLIYGSRDEFAIRRNVERVASEYANIDVVEVIGADHVVDARMAQAIIDELHISS